MTTVLSASADAIDQLAGIPPGAAFDAIHAVRANRPQARLHAQQSYLALLDPAAPASGNPSPITFTPAERFAVATFVALLHGEAGPVAFYTDGLLRTDAPSALLHAVIDEAATGAGSGPYGRFPAGVLSVEDAPGPDHVMSPAHADVLGKRLSAALVHAHLLVFHPRDAAPEHLQALLEAGWSTTEIVTLSQLVAFLSFQIRVVVGLRVLSDRTAS